MKSSLFSYSFSLELSHYNWIAWISSFFFIDNIVDNWNWSKQNTILGRERNWFRMAVRSTKWTVRSISFMGCQQFLSRAKEIIVEWIVWEWNLYWKWYGIIINSSWIYSVWMTIYRCTTCWFQFFSILLSAMRPPLIELFMVLIWILMQFVGVTIFFNLIPNSTCLLSAADSSNSIHVTCDTNSHIIADLVGAVEDLTQFSIRWRLFLYQQPTSSISN